jgi:hypothetical protein
MKSVRVLTLPGTLAAGLLLVAGCDTLGLRSSPPIVVSIQVGTDIADVTVPTGGSKQYRQAVTYLDYKKWPEAISALEAVLARMPDNWHARYALAVAQEASGDFANAKTNYIEANRIKGGVADPACKAGVQRIELRGK